MMEHRFGGSFCAMFWFLGSRCCCWRLAAGWGLIPTLPGFWFRSQPQSFPMSFSDSSCSGVFDVVSGVELSVVIPVYNSAEIIPELSQRLIGTLTRIVPSQRFEVILVNDGSRDGSWNE